MEIDITKQQRVPLNLRVAPEDHVRFVTRARQEGRSLGEMFAIISREAEAAREDKREEAVSNVR